MRFTGGLGPCTVGQHYVLSSSNNKTEAICECKPNYVPYSNGHCYRVHTQGPCPFGEMLLNSTSCVPVPCKRGRLYFPRERTCYKIGSRGPCPNGQVVLYDYSARPSLDGISYNGVCGCKSSSKCNVEPSDNCEDVPGMVLVNKTCYKLYTRGPCADGEWLVAQRQPKDEILWRQKHLLPKARCECKPGYTRTNEVDSNSLLMPQRCQAPTVGLAKFLNENVKSLSLR